MNTDPIRIEEKLKCGGQDSNFYSKSCDLKLKSNSEENILEQLFYKKLKHFSFDNLNQPLSIKLINKKFSILFLTKQETNQILEFLQSKRLIQIKKSIVVIK